MIFKKNFFSILGSFCSWVTSPKESLSGKTTLHNWVPRPFFLPSLVLATPWKFCPKCFSDRCHFKYFSLSETTIFTRCQVGSEPQLLPNGGRPEILDVSSSLGGSTHISGFRIWNLPQSLLRSLKESWYPVEFPAGWEMDYLPKKERSVWSLSLHTPGQVQAFASSSQKAATPSFPLTLKPKHRSGLLHSSQLGLSGWSICSHVEMERKPRVDNSNCSWNVLVSFFQFPVAFWRIKIP